MLSEENSSCLRKEEQGIYPTAEENGVSLGGQKSHLEVSRWYKVKPSFAMEVLKF